MQFKGHGKHKPVGVCLSKNKAYSNVFLWASLRLNNEFLRHAFVSAVTHGNHLIDIEHLLVLSFTR